MASPEVAKYALPLSSMNISTGVSQPQLSVERVRVGHSNFPPSWAARLSNPATRSPLQTICAGYGLETEPHESALVRRAIFEGMTSEAADAFRPGGDQRHLSGPKVPPS